MEKRAFQIDYKDNVATALEGISAGESVRLIGEHTFDGMCAKTEIPTGHKLALCDIKKGTDIVKYGVTIGRASEDIAQGSWVHLHNIHSLYDERSSHLDAKTGAPKDTVYV